MSDIYNEIEQEIRRDQALKLWQKLQIPLYVLAALVLIGLGVWKYWENRVLQQQQSRGAAYASALALGAAGKTEDARKALQAIGDGTDGYALMARMTAADDLSARDPIAGAAAFDTLAADVRSTPILRNLARLRAAMLHEDDKDPAEALRRLQELGGPTDPFRASAREQLAILALQRKDYKEADRWLDMIVSDPATPASLRARADSLQGLTVGAGSLAVPGAPEAKASGVNAAIPAPKTPDPSARSPTAAAPSDARSALPSFGPPSLSTPGPAAPSTPSAPASRP